EYPLMPLTPEQQRAATANAGADVSALSLTPASEPTHAPIARPGSIDHRSFYGSIQDQQARGTCVSFATIAALEGVYHRIDPAYKNLKLSEQWAHHLQKMAALRPDDAYGAPGGFASFAEDQAGYWDGSDVRHALR